MQNEQAARLLILKAKRISYHARPSQADYDYWLPLMLRTPNADDSDYWYQRLLGWQAGGVDIPPYGPYGHDKTAKEPDPYPEELGETPNDPPADPPSTPATDLAPVLVLLTAIAGKLDTLIAAVDKQREEVVKASGGIAQAVKDGVKIKF